MFGGVAFPAQSGEDCILSHATPRPARCSSSVEVKSWLVVDIELTAASLARSFSNKRDHVSGLLCLSALWHSPFWTNACSRPTRVFGRAVLRSSHFSRCTAPALAVCAEALTPPQSWQGGISASCLVTTLHSSMPLLMLRYMVRKRYLAGTASRILRTCFRS